jgi:hypothetical protein
MRIYTHHKNPYLQAAGSYFNAVMIYNEQGMTSDATAGF